MTRIGWALPSGGEATGEVFPLGPPSSWAPGEWGEARGPVGTPRKLTRWVRRYEARQRRRARRRGRR